MIGIKKIIFSVTLLAVSLGVLAQEDQIDDLLNEKIINENPVYKPVISFGSGVLNFHGDVKNNVPNEVMGNFGLKFNVSTFVDKKRFFRANFFIIYGPKFSVTQRDFIELDKNLNFEIQDLIDIGVNLEYSFDHIFKKHNSIRPYISVGMENIQFTPKGDLYYKNPLNNESFQYYYWNDGTIRNISQAESNTKMSSLLSRDYIYETDLRVREKDLYGLGSYSLNSFSIPVDAGLDFHLSERISCRLGTALHFTFTDYMDNVSSTGTNIVGKKGNDIFTYNYFSLRFDLFSEPKTQVIERMFAEMEYDDVMFGDDDGDFILDPVDECPGTPFGVVVDTSGCPLDGDDDGIPDYLDEELNTAAGAWVNEKGKTLTEEEFLAQFMNRADAISREEVKAYYETIGKGYVRKTVAEIPEKYKIFDKDKDGYISFDELLDSIDAFFDNKVKFTVEDIYELNNFFFEQ